MDEVALEELKLCAAKQQATQSRIWPMASVLLIFSLGGIAIFGRETPKEWQDVAVIGVAGGASVAVLWMWRFIDWNETFWQDVVYARMWELESRLGFLTNLSIHFLLETDSGLAEDDYWNRARRGRQAIYQSAREPSRKEAAADASDLHPHGRSG